jgi:quercetin dioxygenase-like cupin family protein
MITGASTPLGLTPTQIGRGAFKVKSDNADFRFKATLEPEADFVVRTNDYAPGASTGWHTHPWPVFITVTQGELTCYEVDDPDLFTDSGQGRRRVC